MLCFDVKGPESHDAQRGRLPPAGICLSVFGDTPLDPDEFRRTVTVNKSSRTRRCQPGCVTKVFCGSHDPLTGGCLGGRIQPFTGSLCLLFLTHFCANSSCSNMFKVFAQITANIVLKKKAVKICTVYLCTLSIVNTVWEVLKHINITIIRRLAVFFVTFQTTTSL